MKFLLSDLSLVFPPITNQEGSWLSDDVEVKNVVKNSKLYMMGQRKELLFYEYSFDQNEGVFHFKLKMGDIISPTIRYYLLYDLEKYNVPFKTINIEIGDRLFRVSEVSNPNHIHIWFTPTSFLYQNSHQTVTARTDADHDFDFRQFCTFELLYVGISKENDSLTRLYENAHHARLDILTNLHPKSSSSRVTDELFIFLFDVKYLNVNTFGTIEEFKKDFGYEPDKLKIIADAEKAFVKLLDTEYNSIKYSKYPFSGDGLYSDELERYGYSIAEDISFYTKSVDFHGAYDDREPRDLIIVEGSKAEIVKAYED
ncbi:hypothetical protein E8L90_13265 [Brevibacillus antibioticus]|uniref:Uncharacterized protein n=1 Tax=Brevibacillus antibioticus TaxID=2570228 RepID=A0A4V5TIS1_9BACL|nr:hypothetical protein [Brevibacillus antibioticus]TKI56353.1 hypothetical protein E8L90_13265 [Brevibacillus antibioticus]